MFDQLQERLGGILGRLRKRGALSEGDVNTALREIRLALLEADVALPALKAILEQMRSRALGHEVLKSVTPGQQMVKIVHDGLVDMLGDSEAAPLNLSTAPPAVIMLVGLQGSGKTTTCAKLGVYLEGKAKKRTLMASLDVARPAAQEQLKVLGESAGVATLPVMAGQTPLDIARRALQAAKLGQYDVLILDTAGRLHVNDPLMQEAAHIRDLTQPVEVLLVADAMTGQDALTTASAFHKSLTLTGTILSRMDGDARGGAALSIRHATGQPLKFIGVGEKVDALDVFHPDRVARRILGMGDVVSLVEKASESIEEDQAKAIASRMKKGRFDLEDFRTQLRQMRKMGGAKSLLGMLPGMGSLKSALESKDASGNDQTLRRQEAMIDSMTPTERRNPKIILASRKKRIAAGSGTQVSDVNRLLKQHKSMNAMMKKLGGMDEKQLQHNLGGLMGSPDTRKENSLWL